MAGYVSERGRDGLWRVRVLTTPTRFVLGPDGEPRTFTTKREAEMVRRNKSRETGTQTRADVLAVRHRRGHLRRVQ